MSSFCFGVLAIVGCAGSSSTSHDDECADGSCVDPIDVCAAKGLVAGPNGACVDPAKNPTAAECAAKGKALSADGKACVDPAKKGPTAEECAALGKVLGADGKACVDPGKKGPTAEECAALGKVLSADGTECVAPPPKRPTAAECAALGKVLSADGTECVAPPPKKPTAEECAAQKKILSADGSQCVVASAAECVAQGKVLSADGVDCIAETSPGYTFKGTFGTVDVELEGATLDALHARCETFLAGSSITRTDTVKIDGVTLVSPTYYWLPPNLCAAATLNAKRSDSSRVIVSGEIQKLPFALANGSLATLDDAITKYASALASSNQRVDAIVIGGKSYSNATYYWNGADVTAFLKYGFARNAGPLVAVGTVEQAPFFFTGKNGAEIEAQCTDYFNHTSTWITRMDELVVNDATVTSSTVYWKPADVCMTIRTRAR
jgi:hypothetical protein